MFRVRLSCVDDMHLVMMLSVVPFVVVTAGRVAHHASLTARLTTEVAADGMHVRVSNHSAKERLKADT